MTTFDLAEVRGFAADLDARMDRCDNGGGTECATLDAALRHYAELCCEFREGVREWGREVFSGRVEFNPEVDRAWRDEGWRLLGRAMDLWRRSRMASGRCSNLDGRALLQSALWDLERLLKGWVTPKLAVGPAARQTQALDSAAIEEVRRRVASLPPLPEDWEPDDPRQRAAYRESRTSASSLSSNAQ
jgi:hypothetical protein